MPKMPDVDIEKLLASDFSIPLGTHLGFLKWWYMLATGGLVVIALLLVLFLAGITILSETAATRFRWVGFTLLLSALWNVLPWLAAAGATRLIPAILAQNARDIPAFVAPIVQTLLTPLVSAYSRIGGIAIVVLLIASIGCFIAAATSAPFRTKSKHT